LRKYYIDYYNFADGKRNSLIEKLQKENGNEFISLRNNYHNASLEEFVINKNENTKIVEFNGELVQKMDPIFMDPEYKFIKAHFYSPTKRFFSAYFDTYVINVIVLWIITLLLYVILYKRLLKRLLDSGEALAGRRRRTD